MKSYVGVQRVVSVLKEAPRVPVIIIFILIVVAIFAGWISPHSPLKGSLGFRLMPPAWMDGGNSSYLLGTDRFGRDILSRLFFGARVSMTVASLAICMTATLGTAIGLISGYKGGLVDVVLMRLADLFLAFPHILIALLLAVVFGPSFQNVIIIVLIVYWPIFARQVRGESLAIKQMDYVIVARSLGVSPWKIMWRHIFPNILPSLLVVATYQVGDVIILEATLAFLGVGIPPPNPSWGVMISEGRDFLEKAWWMTLFPGIGLGLTVFSLNMLGDWVRDRLDPKLRQM